MIRTHPQWLRMKALIDEGRIGTLRSIVGILQLSQRRSGEYSK